MAVIIQTVDGVIVNRFDIDKAGLSFGRAASNHVQIDDTAVSTNHAEIVIEENDETCSNLGNDPLFHDDTSPLPYLK